MDTELSLASIRQGDIAADQAWELLSPIIDTPDQALATRICDVLRSWAWKALDRRRRDPALREWADLLNRVEAFFADRFEKHAAKMEQLAELIHESLAVAELASPGDLLRRKHVVPILKTLASHEGKWIKRADLMTELGLKPANMTRLITLLNDVGWVEQIISGREVAYRASTEGISRARSIRWNAASEFDKPSIEFERWDRADRTLHFVSSVGSIKSLLVVRAQENRAFDWQMVGHEDFGTFENDVSDEEDLFDLRVQPPPRKLLVAGGAQR